jgi:hypothetical protein
MTPILHALPLLLWFLAIWLLVGCRPSFAVRAGGDAP